MIIIFAFSAFLLYIADPLEQERHLFINHIVIQFLGILLVSFILDSTYLTKYLNKLSSDKKINSGSLT